MFNASFLLPFPWRPVLSALTQHYTRAAERLCITQPSLSHAIAQMEGELGVPLFEKRGRNVVLTHFGEQFLTCAQQTLATLDEGWTLCAGWAAARG